MVFQEENYTFAHNSNSAESSGVMKIILTSWYLKGFQGTPVSKALRIIVLFHFFILHILSSETQSRVLTQGLKLMIEPDLESKYFD